METTIEPHNPFLDDDLMSAFEYHLEKEDKANLFHLWAQIPGEADGPDWYWVVEMRSEYKGKKFALVVGGCDYTGWDCQSSAKIFFFDTIEEAAQSAKDDYYRKDVAKQLLKQLKGEQPYALYIEPTISNP